MTRNYYEVLGVSETATPNEIKNAYRKLALKWHPDKWVNKISQEREEAKEKMQEINKVFEILGDEELRKKYDLFGEVEFDSGGYDYEAELKEENLRRREEMLREKILRNDIKILDLELEMINNELKALDRHSAITEIGAAFAFTLPRVWDKDLDPALWQPYQRWGEKVVKMEITILKGKDRSEEMREFKEEMRRAIKEAEAVLKIKEEKKKRDDHNSELDEARKAAFEYIEKKWMKKV